MTNPRHIVLVGGGHAHVHVLAAFGKWRESNIRLTLISPDRLTPYSGMTPAVIAGHYSPLEAHIDLAALAAVARASRIEAEVCGIDRQAKVIRLRDGRHIGYDMASINVGVTPDLSAIPGAAEHAIAVKPIGRLLASIDIFLAEMKRPNGPRRVVVIGGGAAGVELLLSLRERLRRETCEDAFSFALITREAILPTHNNRVRDAFRRILRERSVDLYEHFQAARVGSDHIESSQGALVAAHAIFLATGPRAPRWLHETGLDVEQNGFLRVRPTLQCMNDDTIFAAGDCADLVVSPREKSGVYAVRAGPPLAVNLRRLARGEAPVDWRPQVDHLSLISTGDRYAVASRGWFKAEGRWVWTLKSWIDRRWMARYRPE